MKTILVTGGAGFIGSAVSATLLQRGDHVILVDDFNDYYDPGLKEARYKHFCEHAHCTLYRADIRDAAAMQGVFQGHRIDQVCHLAARAGVRASLEQPQLYAETNVIGTQILLECARRANVRDFIYASSSSVYGANTKIPFAETDPVERPLSPYAATKRSCELLASVYHSQFGMHCTGLRFFTVYGPWGRPDMALFSFTKAILEGRSIDVYNNGNMKRGFTYIDDIVQGTVAALDKSYPLEIFNLGNTHAVELLDFIRTLERSIGASAHMRFLPMMSGDVQETSADIAHAEKQLGFSPTTSIEVGIPKFVEWYRSYSVSSLSSRS